ncbi:RNA methyltransferase [Tenacibaculum finnmarkense genomovar finnmarkense]|uniref:RNA methyltransferase n=1 Tax=Tenacibaculum finnmarkense TaxID=2781243 RepID=UPI000C4F701B|nr:RNA methyltransferase [Tenacibaculum finnmarkense]MBE7660031.1 RNA methyltransferase [Tenacibaculum finnmarkense genomovar finnmarkense]MBE7693034.1 RNA methyltransferase [Tenacibaculum finnmarkense genomovar finnmarkense]MCD8403001.1 RNA methyltransferase [Tenacibaculum finnmarkense genomovar finnmarkense]MCD8412010.1 RNA methyltransferase [Tenacibaculum finnmarkense genomovar ulcerans]MCD8416432.1 RNA methyltransferase [Tenacibaculum finnmarkense genomovar finnmarkense]
MSLSKSNLKLITSLQQKKYRQKHQLFVAEGVKVVAELLKSSVEVAHIFTVDASFEIANNVQSTLISEVELKKISTLKNPNKVLGLFKIPTEKEQNSANFTLALDEVNDPGNLGTIIRLCDWFGITELVCSKNTVDCYNQKVVQSTMGSLTRVHISYVDLPSYLKETPLAVYTADMDGENIYKASLPEKAVLVMGNEANGISNEIAAIVKHKLTIPRFGDIQKTESLNVATATAILLSEFKRSLV